MDIQLTVTLSAPGEDLSQDRAPARPKTQPMNAPGGISTRWMWNAACC